MKNSTLNATLLALCGIVSLCGMLLCRGGWDILFFCLALLPLVWGALSARTSR